MSYILYFVYFLFISIFTFYGDAYQIHLRKLASIEYNSTKYLIFSSIFPIILGILFALPEHMYKIKAEGKWNINKPKLIAIGIPSFYVSVMQILSFSPIGKYLVLFNWILHYQLLPIISGILLGYTLLSSLNKNNE